MKPRIRINTLFSQRGLIRRCFILTPRLNSGAFGVGGLKKPSDFPRLAMESVRACVEDLDAAKDLNAKSSVHMLDGISNRLCVIADAAELCRHVHPDQEWVAAANNAVEIVAELMNRVNVDEALYQTLSVAKNIRRDELSDEEILVLNNMIEAMEFSGVHLPTEQRMEVQKLSDIEGQLSYKVLTENEGEVDDGAVWVPLTNLLENVPSSELATLTQKHQNGQEEVLIHISSKIGKLLKRNCKDPSVRRQLSQCRSIGKYEEDFAELLSIRQQLARKRGHKTWNHLAQRESVMGKPSSVQEFIVKSSASILEILEPGLHQLQRHKKQMIDNGHGQSLETSTQFLTPWDVDFIAQHKRECNQIVQSHRLTVATLLNDMQRIVRNVFGLSMVQLDPEPGELWHWSVQKFGLCNNLEDPPLAIAYLDLFQRPGKNIGCAQFTLRCSKSSLSERQIPCTALVCDFFGDRNMSSWFWTPNSGHVRSMCNKCELTTKAARNLMHEFGHVIHSLLSNTEMQHLAGTRGPPDFTEIPSHLFEYFVDEPKGDVAAVLEAASIVIYAGLDQAFYSCVAQTDESLAPNEITDHISNWMTSIPAFSSVLESSNGNICQLLQLGPQTRFAHLAQYGGFYYSYPFCK
eukprot:GHVL01044642.1.p1 GENE.GHVL01044642.1~~GHVL01044642.1.p1  ORF type:complete len:643 (+),score=72.57 GHVL01044642.1:31-1929(+)